MTTHALSRRLILTLLLCLGLPLLARAEGLIAHKSFGKANEIILTFATPQPAEVVGNPTNYRVYEEQDPDIRLTVKGVTLNDDRRIARSRRSRGGFSPRKRATAVKVPCGLLCMSS